MSEVRVPGGDLAPRVTVAHIRPLGNNAIVERLASRLPGGVRINQCVPGVDGDLAALRPDLVITHEPSRIVVIIDVTVPFDNKFEASERARLEKINKYKPLADTLIRNGHIVHVDGFVVSALGTWHSNNDRINALLRALGTWNSNNDRINALLRISQRYASLMRKLMISETIAWSRDVYVEHVSGTRQYCVQELTAREATLSTSTPASSPARSNTFATNTSTNVCEIIAA
ncbi:unnamed protein product [Heterotrigona itama]|uniref:Uncharacterized protein n=1 Tax=Heterotrigona itama TaxID=395501 RepID=A0A6V7GXG4_9HYME|nr:unnamed protein product [Heterotrigona itama]